MFLTSIMASFVMSTQLLWASNNTSAFNIEEAKERCQSHYSQSETLTMNEFSWGYTLESMETKFNEIYNSGKRLDFHAQYIPDENQFYLYFEGYKKAEPVKIDPDFIRSVTFHIETAIEQGFADFVFFPDMGHSHLYFPEQHWNESYQTIPADVKTRPYLYEKMLSDPKMKALYHLTEQLQMLDENKQVIPTPPLPFKYWNRNFLGYNDGTANYDVPVAHENKNYNTVGSLDGHFLYSAGFAVSANKDGCFAYKDRSGKTLYFDIGLHDPKYVSTGGGGEY